MTHLIISREYPPASYPHGGIGTYVEQISRLLAERWETVHVIGELWDGAPKPREELHGGRLIVHRVPLARPLSPVTKDEPGILQAMADSPFPMQAFSWQAARLAESLINETDIDVIEAQDYEAPLYYFLLRRRLGLGPRRRPPCIIHLHSPSEFVVRHNGWGMTSAYDVEIARLEADAIRAADALLCPSDFLAAQIGTRFGITSDAIERIPYPIGDTPFFPREERIWREGAVCYVGRMEPRKGVLEWIEAAIAMAAERPRLRFEFVGADSTLTGEQGGPSVRAALERRVPPLLRPRFEFRDAESRSAIRSRLARAQLLVVPSRWENFPHTCVEAMCSGLPVLASPHGGMSEMIEDGRTGWLAASAQPDDLLSALRRALETPSAVRQQMGSAAAAAIRQHCDNTATIDRQLVFRQRLVRASLMSSGPRTSVASADSPRPGSIAIVVADVIGADLDECLSSVLRQTHPAGTVVIVTSQIDEYAKRWRRMPGSADWHFVEAVNLSQDQGREAGVQTALSHDDLVGITVVDSRWRFEPAFVETCRSQLTRDERLGIVTTWISDLDGRVTIRPPAARPHQWIADDIPGLAVFRTAALRQATWAQGLVGHTPAAGDLALAVLLDGWRAATYPEVLARHNNRRAPQRFGGAAPPHSFRAAIMQRRPELVAEDLPALFPLLEARRPLDDDHAIKGSFTPTAVMRQPFPVQVALARRALSQPRYAAAWISWHGRRVWHATLRRLRRRGI